MDALSELLAPVRARASSWARLDARAPWGVAFRSSPQTFCIHHVRSGAACLTTDRDEHTLTSGDILVVPHGRAHALRDRRETNTLAFDELPAVRAQGEARAWHLSVGATGGETRVLSARIELEDPFAVPIVSTLPPVFRLSGAGPGRASLVALLDHLAREIETTPLGIDMVLARMADVVFVQVMRAYIETMGDESSRACRSLELVSALRDPCVAAAMGAMNTQPAEPWTVASLAELVGMSRSAFAARFTQLVGEPPLAFLTRLRMQKATSLLREGATLAMISQLTGYASEASFSHAFRQWSGMAPGAYRRQRREGPTRPEDT